MHSSDSHDAESEYRIHLLREKQSDPALYQQYINHLAKKAKEEFMAFGRGVLLVVDNGRHGFEGYVPAESADLQFGTEVARLATTYDPERDWILVALTDGRAIALLMHY